MGARRDDYDDPEFRRMWFDTTMTIADIADVYGVTESRAHRAAMQRGLPKRRTITRRVDYDAPHVKAMWHDPSITIREIAGILGVRISSVSQAAENRGWPGKLLIRARAS